MDQDKVLDLCRRLIALNEHPEPGIGSWHVACCNIVNQLRTELNKEPAVGTKGTGAG